MLRWFVPDGIGKASELANSAKPGGFDWPCHGPPVKPFSSKGTALDTRKLAKIVGHEGERSGDVYKITIGRDDLAMKEHGAAINARMGLNIWAAFTGTQEDAVVAGDLAMREEEVTPFSKLCAKTKSMRWRSTTR